jgi:putative hydrolase of the HAD superfamily
VGYAGLDVIRVVFFDAAGTLVRVRGGVGQQYAHVAERFGVTASAAVLEGLFPGAFRLAPPMAFPGADPADVPAREREVWRGLVRQVFAEAGLLPAFGSGGFDRFFTDVYRHFESPSVWAVYPDVPPLLDALRARGCRLGIISNFDGRLLPLLTGLGLAGWFGSVTLSSRVGAVKPDSAIFAHALTAEGVAAPEALHVGDSPVADARGAQGAGLASLLVDRDGRHTGLRDVRRIESLSEVLRFL